MKSEEFLDLRRGESMAMIDSVNNIFRVLDEKAFHTKPSSDKWSIAECFIHLNLTLEHYIPQMLMIIHQKDKYPKLNDFFKHSFLGKMAVKSMTPKPDHTIPYKMKTFSKLQPVLSKGNQNEILNEFLDFQNKTIELIEELRSVNLKKPKIVTAAGPLVKMGIGDALHFMIAHNQRHLAQAKNVLRIIN